MVKKIVFDFDKTLVRINTFPLWILFVLVFSTLKFEFRYNLLILLIQRKISKRISHDEFKREILEIKLSDSYYKTFARIIKYFVNQKVYDLLVKEYQNHHMIIISSAAPEKYLKPCIKKIFPTFNNEIIVIGASVSNGKFSNNYKEEKYLNLLKEKYLLSGELVEEFYTDSIDDLPLALNSKKVILVSPTVTSLNKYKAQYKNKLEII